MGWWTEHVVPRMANSLLDNERMRETRARVADGLRGDVIEIGFGSALNVPHLGAEVDGLWAVDPSTVGRRLGAGRIATSRVPIVDAGLDGQRLALPDGRFDSALSTFTLCTIPHVETALDELLRVLKPGSRYHFVEHGRSPEARVAAWQDRLNPIQKRLGGGCHLNRPIADLIGGAGFDIERLDTYYDGPLKIASYLYEGVARRP